MPRRFATLLPLGLVLLGLIGGCVAKDAPAVPATRIAPKLVVADASPDGKVEALTDRTDPDAGTPEHYMYLRVKGTAGNGAPIRSLDGLGDSSRAFSYSHNWTGRRRLEIMTGDVPAQDESVLLSNGETVIVTIHP